MKSVKRGRAPSFTAGIASLGAAAFGLIWAIAVFKSGGGIFALFGLVFVAIGVSNAVINFRNATGKNRYSEYDITDGVEEPDPLNEHFGSSYTPRGNIPGNNSEFCPYCGTKADSDFEFCRKCGKQLPD